MGSTTAKALRTWAVCNEGITQFYLPPTHEPYLPLLPSRKASLPFGWYSLRLHMKGWPGWVDLGGWPHTDINVPHRELNLDTVTHLSTNWARRWWTSLIEANALTTMPGHHQSGLLQSEGLITTNMLLPSQAFRNISCNKKSRTAEQYIGIQHSQITVTIKWWQ